ncbi:MAG: AAA family ATPase [Alphaproteobacteria bacterium]|nr:AAA family ATPase [Alphaproteobacteria bacterium]MBQ6011573.1 AAA family ATPase [Alphaproteobacteria bacterium]
MAKKKEVLFEFPHPMDNDCLIGHSGTLKTFLDAWEKRNEHPIHPVWMLCGPRGIGKATLAYKIAKMVYGNVGDFFIIDLAHNLDDRGNLKPDAKLISVKTVRAMIEKMQMSSMSGQWRVVLIDAVDELSVAAENAVLKLLEEPPAQILFLLVTHQLSNVLPTVRSRARVEKMHPLTMSELRELCVKFMGDEEVSNEILKLANGSFGKIANLKASGGDAIYEELINALQSKNTNGNDMMNIAIKIAAEPALYGIVLDAIAYFGLADLYPNASQAVSDINRLNLKADITIFKIINEIKKCL